MILSLIGSLKYFNLVWVMNKGGPNNASELMVAYNMKAFPSFEVGHGSTVAFATSVFVMFVALVTLGVGRRFDYRS